MNRPIRRRRRGVVLTPWGLQKLQAARSRVELEKNSGNRFTLEDLGDRTGLSVDTLIKVFARDIGVDRQTLRNCFSAFDLVLEPDDFVTPEPRPQEVEIPVPTPDPDPWEPEPPGGQVPLDSVFYIERIAAGAATRTSIEADCQRAIAQPGALVRIKAPRRTGKTSLIARVLHQAANFGYQVVSLDFQLADKAIFHDLDKFLRWFCASVGLGIQLPNRISNYWDELFGSKVSCKIYFEQYLLAETTTPVVLALDDVDQLFPYPDLADEFFGLLRAWHEEAKNRDIWKKLRLVVAHATDVYIPLSVHKSPFNVGLPVELPPFTPEQVQELAQRHGLNWSAQQTEQLLNFVGGQPYLTRLAIYHVWRQDTTLEQLVQMTPTATGIYRDHLQRQLWILQQDVELEKAFCQVLMAEASAELDLIQAFKLQSIGLIELRGKQAKPSCQLYSQYFRSYLKK
ncbi:AAA-like domain-containing protein (plasmid) [Kovacikia minuta CCNUW1]|uniref:AAA-like domain-containing protein n=1 Tax=Kovacikia minuta TaxID=2931930 RepID=UPI001CCD679F|nr:AAA-like domain-containing protein [Kovacikia minuta]UBF30000.1 AAA-like domain-containing protein [Kovacikia minuta CCNUW1]